MTDPEILDPEGPGSPLTSSPSSGVAERVAQAVQRAIPGHTLRVQAGERGGFRIEAEGKGGTIVIESGPMQTVLVAFGRARFPFLLIPDVEPVLPQIEARVRALAHEELVVLEEQTTHRLVRTLVLGVKDGRLDKVVDSGLEPGTGPQEGPRLSSFEGTWSRTPTREDTRRIERLSGGLLGRLKRKVAEAILERATGAVMGAVDRAVAEQTREADKAGGPIIDDGRRSLKD